MRSALKGRRYRLAFAATDEPVILSYESPSWQSLNQSRLKVMVEASLIGHEDIRAFEGGNTRPKQQYTFFAGRLLGDWEDNCGEGNHVLGYADCPPCNIASIPPD